jgi:dTDP-4-amino-4,6-dideoxygalactose transaminase
LVEDAAESIGSYYRSKHTGTTGLMGVFSFNGNKTITCGGGGCIITNDKSLAVRAKHITTTAKVSHPYEYFHDEIGYNYRLPNINAALACAQLERLDTYIVNKRETASIYKDFCLKNNLNFISEPENCRSNYWLNAIMLSSRQERDSFLKYAIDAKIGVRPIWTLMTKLPKYKKCFSCPLPTAEKLENLIVNLPSGVRL